MDRDVWYRFMQGAPDRAQEERTAMTATGKFQLVPIDQIHDSPLNPRRHLDSARTQELVESMRQHGVIDPLILRPINGQYEIASGHRRRAAAAIVGLQDLPALVRPLTDAELLDIIMVEAVQQESFHPLDEAEGFRRMQKLDPLMTPAAIAARIGKSARYVCDRLTLDKLIVAAKKAFESDALTAAHAIEIARLTPEDQIKALDLAFQTVWNVDGKGHDAKDLIGLHALKAEIARNCKLNLADESTQAELPQLAEAMTVALDAGGPLLEVSSGNKADCPKGVKAQGAWREVGKRDRCDFARPAVVVHGQARRGEVLQVCATRTCKTHFPPKPKPAARAKRQESWQKENAERKAKAEAWGKLRPHAARAVVVATKGWKITERLLDAVIERLASYGVAARIRKAIGPITLRNFGQAVALAQLFNDEYSREAFARTAKTLGVKVNLIAIAKDLKLDEPKVQTSATDEKGKAKPAKLTEGKFGPDPSFGAPPLPADRANPPVVTAGPVPKARARAVSRVKVKGKAKRTRGHK
jgi:ParB/RepB/Spo0J family partition protein